MTQTGPQYTVAHRSDDTATLIFIEHLRMLAILSQVSRNHYATYTLSSRRNSGDKKWHPFPSKTFHPN